KMWTQERFSHEGAAFRMPPRAILPKPYQKPHPPMWVAITSPGTEIDGADRGLGWLGLTFGGLEEQEKRIAEYRRRIKVCEPDGVCIGSPDRIIEAIKKWESVGADRVNFLLNAMEVVPQEEVLASLHLFAKEVMPRFAKTEKAEPAAVAGGGS